MTHPQYVPLIEAPADDGGFAVVNVVTLQEQVDELEVTHVRTRQGKVWKIFSLLNKKSVPLNNAGDGPQRVNFSTVESFGVLRAAEVVLADEGPEADAHEGYDGDEPEPAPAVAHADRAHALLSASGAHRWINCTPSARLEDALPDTTSSAAEEGTAAHELAEHKLRNLAGLDPGPRPVSDWQDEEMEAHTDDYADHVMAELARTKDTSPGAFLAIEERLDFSHLVEDGFGTGDALIVGDGTMTLVDLKYGKGVEVSAEHNPQLQLYALGALHTYGLIYNISRVRLVIFQPRRDNISVWETTVQELLDWAEQVVKPAARLAHAGEGELRAGEWCQFCRHAPQCTALAKQHFQVIPTTGNTMVPAAPAPESLTDEQITQIVLHASEIKKWLTAVETHALNEANQGKTFEGLKLVEGRSIRRYGNEDAVAAAVQSAGHDPYKHELLGITAMTKLLGKKQFDELVSEHLVKPSGKPTLVPEDDPRPALAVATPDTVFQIIEETA